MSLSRRLTRRGQSRTNTIARGSDVFPSATDTSLYSFAEANGCAVESKVRGPRFCARGFSNITITELTRRASSARRPLPQALRAYHRNDLGQLDRETAFRLAWTFRGTP